jgi:hypothetical protein
VEDDLRVAGQNGVRQCQRTQRCIDQTRTRERPPGKKDDERKPDAGVDEIDMKDVCREEGREHEGHRGQDRRCPRKIQIAAQPIHEEAATNDMEDDLEFEDQDSTRYRSQRASEQVRRVENSGLYNGKEGHPSKLVGFQRKLTLSGAWRREP